MGGLYDLVIWLRADGRRLLPRCRNVPRPQSHAAADLPVHRPLVLNIRESDQWFALSRRATSAWLVGEARVIRCMSPGYHPRALSRIGGYQEL